MSYYQQNRLSISSRTILAKIFAEIITINHIIQEYREVLSNLPFHDAISLFRVLDKEEKGYISEKDLHSITGASHRKLLTYAFTWIDHLKIGQISRLQFAVFLLPRQIMAKRLQHPQISSLNRQTMDAQLKLFSTLLTEIMREQMKLIDLRYDFFKQKDYSLEAILSTLDPNNHKWICSQDLYKFMMNYGYEITKRQIERLFQTINYKQNGKISISQIKWIIQGFQKKPNKYLTKIKGINNKPPPQKLKNLKQNFKKYLSLPKKNIHAVEQKFKEIQRKKGSIFKRAQQNDVTLLKTQRRSLSLMQNQVKEATNSRKLQLKHKNKNYQMFNSSFKLQRQLDNLIYKNSQIQAQSQRLLRLQNSIDIRQNIEMIQKNIFNDHVGHHYPLHHPFSFDKMIHQLYPAYHLPLRPSRQNNINIYSKYSYLQNSAPIKFKDNWRQAIYLPKKPIEKETTPNLSSNKKSNKNNNNKNKNNPNPSSKKDSNIDYFEQINNQLILKPSNILKQPNGQQQLKSHPLKIDKEQNIIINIS